MAQSESLPTRGRAYVYGVIGAGAVAVGASFADLVAHPVDYRWTMLAALTIVSGSATVKLPSIPASLSVSETFVFTSVLLFGPAAGTLTVALDGLIISLWLTKKRKELHRILFNMAAPAISIWVASHVFFGLTDIQLLSIEEAPFDRLLPGLLLFTVLYFGLNSWLITFAVAFETGGAPLTIWREHFLWLSLNFFCGASVAALLITVYPRGITSYLAAGLPLLLILPLLFVLYLTYRTSMARVEDANHHLTQVNSLYLSTIETLAMAIDAKDQVTHGHIRRVQAYAVGLARRLGVNDPAVLHAVEAASLLHDMGKLAIPEHILNKPGKLTPSEFEKMKLHAGIGADILSAIHFPYPVVPIVRHHHENWNGTGYPDGLSGVDIPIGARILSVVDCFDALTSDRPYRPALSDEEAVSILLDRRGTMYDPLVVDTFISVHKELAPEPTVPVPHKVFEDITTNISAPVANDTKPEASEVGDKSERLLIFSSLLANAPGRLGVSDICELTWYHLRRILPLDAVGVFVADNETDSVRALALISSAGSSEANVVLSIGTGLSGWVAANRRAIVNSDPRLDFGVNPPWQQLQLRSSCSVPLVRDGHLVGVLTVYSQVASAYTDTHLSLLTVLAPRLAVALEEALRLEKAWSTTRWDPETGLPNRSFLEEFLRAAGDETGRFPGSLLLVHVSECPRDSGRLKELATCLRGSLRAGDLLFRLSDRELAGVLYGADRETALSVSHRLSEEFANSGFERDCWIATASTPADGYSLNDLLAAARDRVAPATQELLTRPGKR